MCSSDMVYMEMCMQNHIDLLGACAIGPKASKKRLVQVTKHRGAWALLLSAGACVDQNRLYELFS